MENCALLLILAKRIPIMTNTGPELIIATVTNVRAINVGVIDRMTDIARPGDITTHTNKVMSGRNRHDTTVVRMVVSTCIVTSVNGQGMIARFCPGRSTQSNSQGNQWHTQQWK